MGQRGKDLHPRLLHPGQPRCALRWRTYPAVSYTHLDVYKRQELETAGQLGGNGTRDLAMCEGEEQREHIAVLKITVIALDGLVDNGPHLLGACLLYTSRCV